MVNWGRETVVLAVVAIPALIASAGVVLTLKAACNIIWHSSCQARVTGVRHLDESVQMSELHLKRSKMRAAAMGN